MTKGDISKSFGRVLKEARLIADLSQEQLALESDFDRTYISMLERGVKVPTLSTIVKLAKSLSVTPVQLITRSQQLANSDSAKPLKKAATKPPFYGTSISCGQPLGGDYEIEKELSLDEEFVQNPAETFFVKASGDSMQPVIWDGDLLIVSFKQKPKNGCIVLAQIENEFTVKRYFKSSKGIRLIPENPNFKEVLISEEATLWICGVVVGAAREF